MTGNPSSLGHAPFAGFAMDLVSLVHAWITRLIGVGAARPALGGLTWADLAVAAAFLVGAAAANAAAALALRRLSGPRPRPAGGAIRDHVVTALGRPLYLAIWIASVYLAAIALLANIGAGEVAHAVKSVADRLLNLGMFAALFWTIQRGTRVLDRRLETWAAATASRLDDVFAMLLGRGLRVAVPVLGVILALPVLDLPPRFAGLVAKATSVLLIGAFAAFLFQAVGIFERAMLARFDMRSKDNLEARRVYTQVRVIGRMLRVVIGVFATASVLMLFDAVRNVGTSLLASAGLVGIVAGIAAQRALGNLFAGIQIALTQPMRQDDVVIVEGEWGRIEEITLTYVVVHIWDDRRLVVPIGYFVEKPFQNWTRNSAQLLGTVYVWVDYSFPVERGREALKRIVEDNPLWDGRFWNLQVTDANDRSMQLRVLATSADWSKSWDLRCQIREQFIDFIRTAHPRSLPTLRAHLGV